MLDLREIDMAIEELERDGSTMGHCTKLAALYTVRDHLSGSEASTVYEQGYSAAAEPIASASDFLRAVSAKDQAAAWAIMDELMDTLKVVNSKVYESVMRKIRVL